MKAMTEDQLEALSDWFEEWSAGFADTAEAHDFFGIEAPSTRAWVHGLGQKDGRLVGRFEPSQMLDTMRSLASKPRWAEWASIEAPRTVISGSTTGIDDMDLAQMLELAPQAESITISASGHDVHLDQPQAVAELITRVVQRTKNNRM